MAAHAKKRRLDANSIEEFERNLYDQHLEAINSFTSDSDYSSTNKDDQFSTPITDDFNAFHNEAIHNLFAPSADERGDEIVEGIGTNVGDLPGVGNGETSYDDDNQDPSQVPLYPGAGITITASILLIISFAMRHSLTGSALADLLVLIELHCVSPNRCKRTLKHFMSFFQDLRAPLEFHYYCENCSAYHGTSRLDVCPICQSDSRKQSKSYFMVIPLIQQLKTLFEDSLMVHIRKFKTEQAKRTDNNIRDTVDGNLYKEVFSRNGYFLGEESDDQLHISLQINTDGVSLFKSSSFGIWPVYFVINELPPNIRFTRSNRIFAGLWFGYSKPNFEVFMRPFAESLKALYETGFQVEEITVRGILLSGVFDSPARSLFMNMVQFNGFHGCPYCVTPGATTKTSERGHTHTYPFDMTSRSGHAELRTKESVIANGQAAENNKQQGKAKTAEFGIKGLSWNCFIPKFDIVRGIAIDYMHCVALGVVKMLMGLWFDKNHKHEHFNVSSLITTIDKRLVGMRPPNFINRLPRSLSELSHFKAAEFKSFLLFYSVPCLYGILPDDVFNHFLLLVQSMYILLSDNITQAQLNKCKEMLMQFVIDTDTLYGARYMTSNVHLLLHLTERVRDLGPLWTSSCFYFEDFNGQLRSLFHGTNNIESQIAFAVQVHQSLPRLSQCLRSGTPEEDLYIQLGGTKTTSSKKEKGRAAVVGAIQGGVLTPMEEHSVSLVAGSEFIPQGFFKRACLSNGQIVHSDLYKQLPRRNNKVIMFGAPTMYGQVIKFVKILNSCQQNECLAIVDLMSHSPRNICTDNSITFQCVVPVHEPSGDIMAVRLDEIKAVCMLSHIDNMCMVSVSPNMMEKE